MKRPEEAAVKRLSTPNLILLIALGGALVYSYQGNPYHLIPWLAFVFGLLALNAPRTREEQRLEDEEQARTLLETASAYQGEGTMRRLEAFFRGWKLFIGLVFDGIPFKTAWDVAGIMWWRSEWTRRR